MKNEMLFFLESVFHNKELQHALWKECNVVNPGEGVVHGASGIQLRGKWEERCSENDQAPCRCVGISEICLPAQKKASAWDQRLF